MRFHVLVKSFRPAWIGRLLGDTDDKKEGIPNFYLYGGYFLLKCNYNIAVLTHDFAIFSKQKLIFFGIIIYSGSNIELLTCLEKLMVVSYVLMNLKIN